MVQRMEDIMGKATSRGQALELSGRFAMDTNWDAIDGDDLQRRVVELDRKELGRRFTAFLRNGCQFTGIDLA